MRQRDAGRTIHRTGHTGGSAIKADLSAQVGVAPGVGRPGTTGTGAGGGMMKLNGTPGGTNYELPAIPPPPSNPGRRLRRRTCRNAGAWPAAFGLVRSHHYDSA